jgi:hypothetical protein
MFTASKKAVSGKMVLKTTYDILHNTAIVQMGWDGWDDWAGNSLYYTLYITCKFV